MATLVPKFNPPEVEPLGQRYDRIVSNSRIIWSEAELGGPVIQEVGGEESPDVYVALRDRDETWDGILPLAVTKLFANDPIGVNNAWKELDAILIAWAAQHEGGKPVTRDQRWEHFWHISDLEGNELQECLNVVKWNGNDRQKQRVFRELLVKYRGLSGLCHSILIDYQDVVREVEAEWRWRIWNDPMQIAYRNVVAEAEREREARRKKAREYVAGAEMRRQLLRQRQKERERQRIEEGGEIQVTDGDDGEHQEGAEETQQCEDENQRKRQERKPGK